MVINVAQFIQIQREFHWNIRPSFVPMIISLTVHALEANLFLVVAQKSAVAVTVTKVRHSSAVDVHLNIVMSSTATVCPAGRH